MFLATYWNLLQKSGHVNFFLFEIWRIWTIFPMKNPLYYWSKSHFSGRIFAKIRQ